MKWKISLSLLLLIASGIYVFIMLYFHYGYFVNETMFQSIDARSYNNVADWLLDKIDHTGYTSIRPFLYPLFIAITKSIAGINGIWIFQFFLWLSSGILIFSGLKRLTLPTYLCVITSILFYSNVSLVLLTIHALSEVTTTFFICFYLYVIVMKDKIKKENFWGYLILASSLLTIIRPVFQILLLVNLIYVGVMVFRQKYLNRKSFYLKIFLALIPIFIQLLIMKTEHGKFAISNIAAPTLKNYFFSEVYSVTNHITIEEARVQASRFTIGDMSTYLVDNFQYSWDAYWRIFQTNIRSVSGIIDFPKPNPFLHSYMKQVNAIYWIIHLVMTAGVLGYFILMYRRRNKKEMNFLFLTLLPIYIVLFTSPMTFWQGDRIVIPVFPLWLIVYTWILYRLFQEVISRRTI